LVLVEGYKASPIPKLEVHRPAHGQPAMYPDNRSIVAVASDARIDTTLPLWDINDYDGITDYILRFLEFR
jgi:molybdopterin-guanine dinucleotide biosynthesis protein B